MKKPERQDSGFELHQQDRTMKNNINTFSITRINNCEICKGHFQPLRESYKFCPRCYHGMKAGKANAIAIEQLRLANVTN